MRHLINHVFKHFRASEAHHLLIYKQKVWLLLSLKARISWLPWYIPCFLQVWNILRMVFDGRLEDGEFGFICLLKDILSMMDSLSRYYEYQKRRLFDLMSYISSPASARLYWGLLLHPETFSSLSPPCLTDNWLLERQNKSPFAFLLMEFLF